MSARRPKTPKKSGLHWAVRAQISRSGGFRGSHDLGANEIDGFTQSLRETNLNESPIRKQDVPHPIVATGGYNGESPETPPRNMPVFLPPGLGAPLATEPDPAMITNQFAAQ